MTQMVPDAPTAPRSRLTDEVRFVLAAVLGAAVPLLPILVGWYAPAGECEGLLALPWWFTPLALLFSIGIPFLAAALRLSGQGVWLSRCVACRSCRGNSSTTSATSRTRGGCA